MNQKARKTNGAAFENQRLLLCVKSACVRWSSRSMYILVLRNARLMLYFLFDHKFIVWIAPYMAGIMSADVIAPTAMMACRKWIGRGQLPLESTKADIKKDWQTTYQESLCPKAVCSKCISRMTKSKSSLKFSMFINMVLLFDAESAIKHFFRRMKFYCGL